MAISSTTLAPEAYRGLVAPRYPAGDAMVIVASGHLDAAGFLAVNRRLTEALEDGRRYLLLDLHEVDGIEPDALGFLWATLRGVRRRGATLGVVGARPSLLPALKALDSGGLSIHADIPAPLSAAQKPVGTA